MRAFYVLQCSHSKPLNVLQLCFIGYNFHFTLSKGKAVKHMRCEHTRTHTLCDHHPTKALVAGRTQPLDQPFLLFLIFATNKLKFESVNEA